AGAVRPADGAAGRLGAADRRLGKAAWNRAWRSLVSGRAEWGWVAAPRRGWEVRLEIAVGRRDRLATLARGSRRAKRRMTTLAREPLGGRVVLRRGRERSTGTLVELDLGHPR